MLAAPAFAEWYKDYEAAMEMYEKGQLVAAIPRLQAAVRQKNDEGVNIKFYGMKFGDYFPHYYLGLAYFSQKNYEAAIKEFEISEKQGAIFRKPNLMERLNSNRTLAKAQLIVKENPQIAQQNPPIEVPVVKPSQEEKKPAEEVKTPTQEEKKPVEVAQVQPEEKKPAEELKTTTPPEKKPEEKIASAPEIKPTIPKVDPALLEDPNSDVRKKMLRNGARKYFEGDYDSAILYLDEVQKLAHNDAPVTFLLGCSYASKYLLSGSQNKQLLDQASLLFRKVKKIDSKYRPKNKTYLSPAVLEIYEKTT
jgi:tetratricopeptide (TPR) repeat protein